MIASRLRAVPLLIALLGVLGCHRSPLATTSTAKQPVPSELDLVHNIGAVLAGKQVEHSFAVENRLDVPIFIADDADMEKSCGCINLEPSADRVAPGETTAIRVRVDTSGKNGPFRVGGVIRWRTDDGESWPVNMYLEGTAKSILVAQPGLVQFSPAEVQARATKELVVFTSDEIDSATLCVDIEPPYAVVVEQSVQSDQIRLSVRPSPPPDMQSFSAILRCTAATAEEHDGVAHCQIAVPMQGSQDVGVHVVPRVVFANWSREFQSGTTRFLVRGLSAAAAESISAIYCDGLSASWAAKEISPANAASRGTLQVEVNLSNPVDPAIDVTQVRHVRIDFKSNQSVEVPVRFVIQHERS